ncbi:DUF6199 family natural product biosynthesis protein [Paenibacillus xerothermodurans]|uniref:DUF6199 domain-containing protein n=1 Tax=Paenibacillus xerothermodurans TaxID=1977292 RepID=A0A2W1NZK9_PAEXE|nr:hypothetical protein CBW46_009690 [Paenibacillus xerothermodurans]
MLSILLIVGGSFMLFKTSWFWSLTAKWTSEDGTEPSHLFIWNTRLGGSICLLLGLVGLFVTLLME